MWSNWATKIIDTASLPSCPVELTPTQAATWIAANLVVDGVPVVTWSPKLPLGMETRSFGDAEELVLIWTAPADTGPSSGRMASTPLLPLPAEAVMLPAVTPLRSRPPWLTRFPVWPL